MTGRGEGAEGELGRVGGTEGGRGAVVLIPDEALGTAQAES